MVRELSERKALGVKRTSNDTVIGSDTVVYLENKILLKPKNKDDAKKMLSSLSGKKHTVFTGVTVINGSKIITDAIKADVYFRNLSQREIEY